MKYLNFVCITITFYFLSVDSIYQKSALNEHAISESLDTSGSLISDVLERTRKRINFWWKNLKYIFVSCKKDISTFEAYGK